MDNQENASPSVASPQSTPKLGLWKRTRQRFKRRVSKIGAYFNRQKWLDEHDLNDVKDILRLREIVLERAMGGLRRLSDNDSEPYLDPDQIFALASTDVFVEKAQRVLSRRSTNLMYAGVATSAAVLLILLGASVLIAYQVLSGIPSEITTSTQALIFRIFQSIALSAFILVTIKWLLSLTRSFFHEATSLLERRHALRYGRLYVYLKKGKVTDKGLIEAFQWNKETRTSFLDIKPETVSETLFHKIFELFGKVPPEMLKAASDFYKTHKGGQ